MMIRKTLTLIVLLLGVPAAAHAACFDYCAQLCKNESDLDHNTCTIRCANTCVEDNEGHYSFTGTAPVTGGNHHFAAIALSPASLLNGHAFGYATQAEAETEAARLCRDGNPAKPGDCKIILSFENACAALALRYADPGPGGFWGNATAPTEAEAAEKAGASCKAISGGACAVAYSFCSKPR